MKTRTPKTAESKRTHRPVDDRIAELEEKIAAIKARDASKQAKAQPVGKALLLAKCAAAALGIALHLGRVHAAVASLAAFYATAAVLPWAAILFA